MKKPKEQQQIFDVIWANKEGLPQSLFGNLNQINAKNEFVRMVSSGDNNLFKFISTK